jgi:hypothetical protein
MDYILKIEDWKCGYLLLLLEASAVDEIKSNFDDGDGGY